jgi:hypothetical protein
MWEKLLELAIFTVTKEHRKPVDILKGFITKQHAGQYRLLASQKRILRRVFKFIKDAYRTSSIGHSRLATDHTHFYILATTLISTNILTDCDETTLINKLTRIAEAMQQGGPKPTGQPGSLLKQYMEMSEKQTTDVAKRNNRVGLFSKLIASIDGTSTGA